MVEIEEGALAAEFFKAGVGQVIDGVELVEGLDENGAAGEWETRRWLNYNAGQSRTRTGPRKCY